jgi:hypothetical protein
MLNSNEPDMALILYRGVAQLELDQYENALNSFRELIISNTIDHHKGYWYTAMVYLKQGNKELLVESLEIIAANPSYYNHEESLALLKELK